jgi:hypothetical protein
VSTPHVRYIRACPPTNQSQDAKKGEHFQIQNFKKFQKFQEFQNFPAISKL